MSDSLIRVLVVEDDPRISELHMRFVQKVAGFEVVGVANSIGDAHEMIDILEPDLVLLDLFFPQGNGLELLRDLRSGDQPCDVILITAAREMGPLQEALRGGIFDYIIKPVHFPRFAEALDNYRIYLQRLQAGGPLEQKDVDRLLRVAQSSDPVVSEMPKGIDPLTLAKVRKVFAEPDCADLNAEEVGKQVGISRSTARRYLEYLVSDGILQADLIYGVVGRPERRYLRCK